MPSSQRNTRCGWGFGLKNVMACPRNVWGPAADPTGAVMPLGNGLESVPVKLMLSVVGTTLVFWLKPLWITSLRRAPRKP